jgi:UDP-N-acetylmuramyl pentapeptide phosphotransferase/UDP-N-acetylglucosamine-1-phosphate transferase
MPPGLLLAIVAGSAFAASCVGTRALATLLRRRAVLDRPNERSLHDAPTPVGGGIAIVGTIAAVWAGLCAAGVLRPSSLAVVLDMAGLAAVSWIDDLHGLSPGVRLLAQFVAVAAGIWALPHGTVFQNWLPPGLDAIATALIWVWFLNLFNFMDGIDGMAGSEAVAIGLGLVAVVSLGVARDLGVAAPGAGIAAAALGFLVWNWTPARIFMGDVGSVPLGYVLGYLLCRLAIDGWWKAALILPLYFLADATLTLLRRIVRGERVWQAHREHFYQRAVQRGLGHDAVVLRVITADTMLIGCAWAAENVSGFAGLALAALTVALLLVALSRGSGRS